MTSAPPYFLSRDNRGLFLGLLRAEDPYRALVESRPGTWAVTDRGVSLRVNHDFAVVRMVSQVLGRADLSDQPASGVWDEFQKYGREHPGADEGPMLLGTDRGRMFLQQTATPQDVTENGAILQYLPAGTPDATASTTPEPPAMRRRLYLNAAATAAPDVVRNVIRKAGPVHTKVVIGGRHPDTRTDRIVFLPGSEEQRTAVREEVAHTLLRWPSWAGSRAPLLTQSAFDVPAGHPLDCVGEAEDPVSGGSFHEARLPLLLEAVDAVAVDTLLRLWPRAPLPETAAERRTSLDFALRTMPHEIDGAVAHFHAEVLALLPLYKISSVSFALGASANEDYARLGPDVMAAVEFRGAKAVTLFDPGAPSAQGKRAAPPAGSAADTEVISGSPAAALALQARGAETQPGPER